MVSNNGNSTSLKRTIGLNVKYSIFRNLIFMKFANNKLWYTGYNSFKTHMKTSKTGRNTAYVSVIPRYVKYQ